MSQKKPHNLYLEQLNNHANYMYGFGDLIAERANGASACKETLIKAESSMLLALAESLDMVLKAGEEEDVATSLTYLIRSYVSLRSEFIGRINQDFETTVATIESAKLQYNNIPLH